METFRVLRPLDLHRDTTFPHFLYSQNQLFVLIGEQTWKKTRRKGRSATDINLLHLLGEILAAESPHLTCQFAPMQSSRPLLIFVLVTCISSLLLTGSHATHTTFTDPTYDLSTCGPCVRRPWSSLTSTKQQLIIDAFKEAMMSGDHAAFAESRSELQSFQESQLTCAHAPWHRRFLLAYERMLRGQGSRFSCLCLPYWPVYEDRAKFVAQLCSSFGQCSSILQAFGGPHGSYSHLFINGVPTQGECVAEPPMNEFCQQSNLSPSQCAKCITRGNWNARCFPSEMSYSSLAYFLSMPFQFAWYSSNVHNMAYAIYNAMGGAMTTRAAASEPIYILLQTTVDMLHQKNYDCQIGYPLSDYQKRTSAFAYQTCNMSSSAARPCPSSYDDMTMNWQLYPNPAQHIESHPKIGKYFSGLPRQIWFYLNANDLGYTYETSEVDTLLLEAGMNCPAGSITRDRRLLEGVETVKELAAYLSSKSSTARLAMARNAVALRRAFKKALAVDSNRMAALEQTQLVECAYNDKVFGSTEDYSDEMREQYNIPDGKHTVCYEKMGELRSGRKRIWDKYWFSRFYNTVQGFEDTTRDQDYTLTTNLQLSEDTTFTTLEGSKTTEFSTISPVTLTEATSTTSTETPSMDTIEDSTQTASTTNEMGDESMVQATTLESTTTDFQDASLHNF